MFLFFSASPAHDNYIVWYSLPLPDPLRLLCAATDAGTRGGQRRGGAGEADLDHALDRGLEEALSHYAGALLLVDAGRGAHGHHSGAPRTNSQACFLVMGRCPSRPRPSSGGFLAPTAQVHPRREQDTQPE